MATAFTCQELYESRTLKLDGPLLSGKRVFKVFATGGGQIKLAEAYGCSGLPQIGDLHPEIVTLKAVEHDGLHEVGIGVYRITWFYEGVAQDTLTDVISSVRIYQANIDEWRDDPIVPSSGDLTPASLSIDIDGTAIDEVGRPLTRPRLQQSIQLTEFYDQIFGPPPFDVYGLSAQTRNSEPFIGADTGTMLYLGASSRQYRNSILAITHSFVWDQKFHLVQIVGRNQISEPELEEVGGRLRAKNVFWRQPFPNKTDFNQLSTNF